MASNTKWDKSPKIVIGIDIGTTQSAVSTGLLEPGVNVDQALQTVLDWPGQVQGRAKVPTLIWYDTDGKAVSFGAEALSFLTQIKAKDEKWFLAKHFKLHLHLEELRDRDDLQITDPFRYGVTLEQVYCDFLGYLFKHAEEYFKERIFRGKEVWELYRDTMEFVIAHPNTWSTRQQAFLRKVAAEAGLVHSSVASKYIRFVTEAEASFHFCLRNSNLTNYLELGNNFLVCDAGGLTVDTTLYSATSTSPFQVAEKRIPKCAKAGAIHVDLAAEAYMKRALERAEISENDLEAYIEDGIADFEAHPKRSFCNENEECGINIGNSRFTLTTAFMTIRRGRLIVPGAVFKSFFDGCVKKIFADVDKLLQGTEVSDILLVGGFGESPYLRNEFRKRYEHRGAQITLMHKDSSTSKAVADGAIIWSYTEAVTIRRPHSTFGTTCATHLDVGNPAHLGRNSFTGLDGREYISGKWETLVIKDEPLLASSVNRKRFVKHYSTESPNLGNFRGVIEAYIGDDPPYWSRTLSGLYRPGFRAECNVTANLQNLSGGLKKKTGPGGEIYWELEFKICIRFGGVGLEAYVEWEEDNKTCEGPVTLVPDQPITFDWH